MREKTKGAEGMEAHVHNAKNTIKNNFGVLWICSGFRAWVLWIRDYKTFWCLFTLHIHIYICMYIYIYIYMYIYIYVYMYMYICMYVYVYPHIYKYIYIYICMYTSVYK